MSDQKKIRTDFNPITGATLVTKFNGTKQFSDNWNAIFGKKEKVVESNFETSGNETE